MGKNLLLNTLIERVAKRLLEDSMDVKTIPAAKSKAEQEMASELAGKITKNPNKTMPPSQKSIKLKAVKNELDKLGYTHTTSGAKRTTQELPAWYDELSDEDKLLKTASELAADFSKSVD